MSRALKHLVSILLQIFQAVLPCRTVHISRLTKPAAANTAALNFQHHPVLGYLNVGHNWILNIGRMIHVHHDFLRDPFRNSRAVWKKGGDCSVLLICHIVEYGCIDSRKFCSSLQKFQTAPAFFADFLIQLKQSIILGFSLTDIKQIEKLCQRLRIIGAGTSANHNGIVLVSVRCVERNPTQIQYLKNIGVAHFVLNGNSKKIKILYGILRFQRKQADTFFAHQPIQICPRRKYPFTVNVLPLVEHGIEDLHAQMGHTDLIHVGKAHGKTNIHRIRIFQDRIHLIADIAGGLLDRKQYFIT